MKQQHIYFWGLKIYIFYGHMLDYFYYSLWLFKVIIHSVNMCLFTVKDRTYNQHKP